MGVMAAGLTVPDTDHVTRGCARGFDQGEVTSAAFAMRRQEQSLARISVDWVECIHAPEQERSVAGSIKRMMDIPVHPPYAVLSVGKIRQLRVGSLSLDVEQHGTQRRPCHCAIIGFTGTAVDLRLQSYLAELANKSEIVDGP